MKKIITLLIVLALLTGCQLDKPDYQYATGAGGEGTALTIDCTAKAQWDIIEIKFPFGRTDTFYFDDFCDDME